MQDELGLPPQGYSWKEGLPPQYAEWDANTFDSDLRKELEPPMERARRQILRVIESPLYAKLFPNTEDPSLSKEQIAKLNEDHIRKILIHARTFLNDGSELLANYSGHLDPEYVLGYLYAHDLMRPGRWDLSIDRSGADKPGVGWMSEHQVERPISVDIQSNEAFKQIGKLLDITSLEAYALAADFLCKPVLLEELQQMNIAKQKKDGSTETLPFKLPVTERWKTRWGEEFATILQKGLDTFQKFMAENKGKPLSEVFTQENAMVIVKRVLDLENDVEVVERSKKDAEQQGRKVHAVTQGERLSVAEKEGADWREKLNDKKKIQVTFLAGIGRDESMWVGHEAAVLKELRAALDRVGKQDIEIVIKRPASPVYGDPIMLKEGQVEANFATIARMHLEQKDLLSEEDQDAQQTLQIVIGFSQGGVVAGEYGLMSPNIDKQLIRCSSPTIRAQYEMPTFARLLGELRNTPPLVEFLSAVAQKALEKIKDKVSVAGLAARRGIWPHVKCYTDCFSALFAKDRRIRNPAYKKDDPGNEPEFMGQLPKNITAAEMLEMDSRADMTSILGESDPFLFVLKLVEHFRLGKDAGEIFLLRKQDGKGESHEPPTPDLLAGIVLRNLGLPYA